MRYQIVPRAVGIDRAALWLGAFYCAEPPKGLKVQVSGSRGPVSLSADRWTPIQPEGLVADPEARHFWQEVDSVGLEPGCHYDCSLIQGVSTLATASFSTLPRALPALGEKPFTVLLGSCFCRERDEQGDAGFSFFWLPDEDRPAVKILCGDQVYLDFPTWKNFPDDEPWLSRFFLDKYVETWTQSDAAGQRGYRQILQEGATYFASDDHEFWNNYPNWATLIQNSWTQAGRDRWARPARYLLRVFQNNDAGGLPARFDVPPVSFLILDCRFDRQPGEQTFSTAAQMASVSDWVRELNEQRRFGVLCLGQPLFDAPGGGFSRMFKDRTLPDYEQYGELARILSRCRQPLVIVTGDVHFGRLARSRLASQSDLFEIISSPTALVDPLVGGKAYPPPDHYPARALPGIRREKVAVELGEGKQPVLTADEHYLTISLWSKGASVRMRLKYWPVRTRGQRPVPIKTADVELVPAT